ncbi:hypothetical protein ACH9L7_09970 [Haloferax sp. S1W]|uniref:hypothetical protein n=1 Tax=Haloferax sp. S1W TaxID=3377110 RepID=UPI0037C6FBC6
MEITINEIKPSSVYQGRAYTQTVIATLPDGETVQVDDFGMEATDEDIDDVVEAKIRGLSVQLPTINNGQCRKIEPTERQYVNIYGQVIEVFTTGDCQLLVDIGDGQIEVGLGDIELGDIEVGDWIKVPLVDLLLDEIKRN